MVQLWFQKVLDPGLGVLKPPFNLTEVRRGKLLMLQRWMRHRPDHI
jgi:hypothetical protein